MQYGEYYKDGSPINDEEVEQLSTNMKEQLTVDPKW